MKNVGPISTLPDVFKLFLLPFVHFDSGDLHGSKYMSVMEVFALFALLSKALKIGQKLRHMFCENGLKQNLTSR